MEIIAIYNLKGGVGKTTTAVNLAYRSAREGWPTLLWDLDPQGAATFLLRREAHVEGGAKELIRGDVDPSELIVATDYPNLDLLPADFSYRRMDVHLHQRKNSAKRLFKLMRPLKQRHACLMLDCAPGISLVSENIMHAADALVVPLLPSPLSVQTLEQLLDFVARKKWADLKVLPFFSMVDRRKRLHKETTAKLRKRFPLILSTEVPYGSEFERITLRRAPIEAYAPRSAAAEVYRALWREIDARLEGSHAVNRVHARNETPAAGASESGGGEIVRPAAGEGASGSEVERELNVLEIDFGKRGLVAAAQKVAER
jgi:cellulose biosynthesis protein BcsQ